MSETRKQPPPQGDADATERPMRRSSWRRLRRVLAAFGALIVVLLVVIGPWPADSTTYVGSDYQKQTLDRLRDLDGDSGWTARGQLRVGLAEVDITPPVGTPLAGFGSRDPMASDALHSRVFARAITLEVADRRVTILTADLLAVTATLADAVVRRAGLAPGDVYFTASHTHSSRGGWGRRITEQQVGGAYDPDQFDDLADALAQTVTASREKLEPAAVAYADAHAVGRVENRIHDDVTTRDLIQGLIFRPRGEADAPPLAVVVVFGAHATVLGSRSRAISADYPGALVERVRERTGATFVAFAAGAVGDLRPVRPAGTDQQAQAEIYGRAVADDLLAAAPTDAQDEIVAGNVRLPVTLPAFRVPVGASWRWSPIVTGWASGNRTHLHVLRIGDVMLAGFPGDYAGHLAEDLDHRLAEYDLRLVATSFNGDFKGYFVGEQVYRDYSAYETRSMSFFGPWAGDYLNDLTLRMTQRLRTGD